MGRKRSRQQDEMEMVTHIGTNPIYRSKEGSRALVTSFWTFLFFFLINAEIESYPAFDVTDSNCRAKASP